MGRARKGLTVLALLGLLGAAAAATPRMNTTADHVEPRLGESVVSTLVLHNPLEQSDIYRIQGRTVMDNGVIAVGIRGDERTADRVQVEVGAGSSRTVQVRYTGAACSSSICTGTVTFVGRSLETDRRFTASTDVTIRRDTEVYGSPGITLVQLLAVALIGTAVSLIDRRLLG